MTIQQKVAFFFLCLLLISSRAFSQDPLTNILEVYGDSNMALGTGMRGLGDVNNDGWDDFAVSAEMIRKTFIYFGGPGKLHGTPDVTLEGGNGIRMGDINGDGKKDLIIAVPSFSNSDSTQVDVYLWKHSQGFAYDTIPDLVLYQTLTGDNVYEALAVGDINNDGYDDIVVGQYFYGLEQGIIRIYFGKQTPSSTPDVIQIGDSITAEYGYKVDIADVNGDGVKDLLVSARRKEKGTLDIFYGKKGFVFNKDNYDQRLSTAQSGLNLIYNFTTLDVNADSIADISFCPGGIVSFFLGKKNAPLSTKPDFTMSEWEAYGYDAPASDIGDINGDGKRDFVLMEATGGQCIDVFLGQKNPTSVPAGIRCGPNYYIVTGVGDVNGDGVNDFGATIPSGDFDTNGYFVIFSGNKYWVTPVKQKAEKTPMTDELNQNYPNPFNPETVISYQLSVNSYITLKVYNVLGEEILILANDERAAGNYTVHFDGSNLPSGVYYYMLSATDAHGNRQTETKQMTLLK
jgi:FG-GAP-like repeat/Secretion system C-terminal sorting domain